MVIVLELLIDIWWNNSGVYNSVLAIVLLLCKNFWAILPPIFTCLRLDWDIPMKNQCTNSQLLWVSNCSNILLPRNIAFCTSSSCILGLIFFSSHLTQYFLSLNSDGINVLFRNERSSTHHCHLFSILNVHESLNSLSSTRERFLWLRHRVTFEHEYKHKYLEDYLILYQSNQITVVTWRLDLRPPQSCAFGRFYNHKPFRGAGLIVIVVVVEYFIMVTPIFKKWDYFVWQADIVVC